VSAWAPELAEMFLGRAAIGYVGFFSGIEGSQMEKNAVDANASPKTATFVHSVDAFYSKLVGAQYSRIFSVSTAPGFSKIFPAIVGGITVAVIYVYGVLSRHPFPDQPMGQPILVTQAHLGMAKTMCGGSSAFSSVHRVPSREGFVIDKMRGGSLSPHHLPRLGVIIEALAQVGLLGHNPGNHIGFSRKSRGRVAPAFERRCDPQHSIFAYARQCAETSDG